MSETPTSHEKQLPLTERILAVPEFNFSDALALGTEYVESSMVPPSKLDASFSDTAMGPAIEDILKQSYEQDRDVLEAASSGDLNPLGEYLKAEGRSTMKSGLRVENSPDRIKQLTLGSRLFKMGMLLSNPQSPQK